MIALGVADDQPLDAGRTGQKGQLYCVHLTETFVILGPKVSMPLFRNVAQERAGDNDARDDKNDQRDDQDPKYLF